MQLDITNVVIDHRDGLRGWAGQAPYDQIILTGSVKVFPKPLKAQLSDKGVCLYVMDSQLMRYQGGQTQICTALDLPRLEPGLSKGL